MTSATAASGPASPGTMVEAVGTGYASAAPDQMTFTVCAYTQAATISAALKANNNAISKVRAVLSSDGIAADDMQTTGFSIVPDYSGTPQPGIVSYHVQNCLQVTVRDLSKDGKILDDVAAAGGNATEISSVQFVLSNPAPLDRRARDDAYNDADAKVTQDAQNAGMRTCVPDTVTDNGDVSGFRPLPVGADASQSVPLSEGKVSRQVTISLAKRCFS